MGGSWEAASTTRGCVCGRLAGGQACACTRERERGGAKGAAWPCHAGWPRGRAGGRRRGAGRQGCSVTRPAGLTEVAKLPAA